MLSPAVRAGEQGILAIEGNGPDGALDDVGVDLDPGPDINPASSVRPGVAEQLGGRLVLRSRKGEGTIVELWLPCASPAEQSSEVDVDEASRPSHTRPLTILVVYDDELVLMNTAAMLEDLDHKVFEANSGKRALAILEREPGIDLVITDQAMPQMTGLQLAEAIRARLPILPIVLATGYAELPPQTGTELPRLAKPFWRQHDLARAVAAAISAELSGSVLKFPKRNR